MPLGGNALPKYIVIDEIGAASEALYVRTIDGGIGASSWKKAPILYVFDAKTKKVEHSGLYPRSPIAFTDIVAEVRHWMRQLFRRADPAAWPIGRSTRRRSRCRS